MMIKERLHARRVARWQRQVDTCSDAIFKLSLRLQNMDQIKEWEAAEAIRAERVRVWNRRNTLHTKLTQE